MGHQEAAIRSASGSAVQPHERAGEVGRGEGAQILGPLADPDRVHRLGGWTTPELVGRYTERLAAKRGRTTKLAALRNHLWQ